MWRGLASMAESIVFHLSLDLSNLEGQRDKLSPEANRRIDNHLSKAFWVGEKEKFGYIYIYTLISGDIKIGRTEREPIFRLAQQKQYQEKYVKKVKTCRNHVMAETLILNFLDYARKGRLEEFDGEILSREEAEFVMEEVTKAIDRAMEAEEKDDEDSWIDLGLDFNRLRLF